MGDHAYAYRGQHSSVYGDDGRKDRTYGGSDKICQTVIYDSDGRQRTVLSPSDYYDTETTYVTGTEVTEYVLPVHTYRRYGSPPPQTMNKASERYAEPYGIASTYVGKIPRPASPAGYYDCNRRPQEVDEFLTGVQVEASRAPNPYRRPASSKVRPAGSGHGGGRGEYRKGNNYGGGYSSNEEDDDDDDDDDDDRDDDRYYYKPKPTTTTTTTRPQVPSPKAYGNGGGRYSSSPPGQGKLSRPTSSIDEAVQYLKGTTKPYEYGTKYPVAPEPVKPYGTTTNSTYGSEASKPYGTKYQQTPETVIPYGNGGYGGEAAKPHGTTTKYQGGTGTGTGKVMDCYEAARKYNGKVIRT